MKLLVDSQLPFALAAHLRGWGLDCLHVLDLRLADADDATIWNRAITDARIIVSKDDDFLLFSARPGDTGRLIWVRLANCRSVALLAAFDRARPSLLEALESGQRVVELR